jgi:transposase
MQVTRIGIDIAKRQFDVHGVDERGQVVLRRALKRERVREFMAQLPPCEIGMEACGGAHYWHRELSKLGHTVRLLSAHKVKPYVLGNKNNRHDAAAICEAMSRPSMRFVEPKSTAQQDIQTLHRARALLLRERTALSNQLRGILHEYGIVMPRGAAALKRTVAEVLAGEEERVTSVLRTVITEQFECFTYLSQRIAKYDRQLAEFCRQDERCRRLLAVEGIGPLSATALVAACGNGREFHNGRHFSAYLGLVPGHSNTGTKTVMLGITKRGNRYLRTLLIHGGRAALYAARRRNDPRSVWLKRLSEKHCANLAAVALANKNARVAWALLRYGQDYCPQRAHAQPSTSARTARPARDTPASAVHGARPAHSRAHSFAAPSTPDEGRSERMLRKS